MNPSARRARAELSELDMPMYSTAEVSRIVGINSTRVGRWIQGYGYVYRDGVRKQAPVIHRHGTEGTSYASFLDLIDLLFIKGFLDYGLSLQKIRKALFEAEQILGNNHFARDCFFTDGKNIYLQVKEEGKAILQLLANGQWVIPEIIRQLAHQIEFDKYSGMARRWYPRGCDGLIVIDPLISFGRPIIVGKGIATSNIYDFFLAEKKSIKPVCDWLGISKREAEAAITFESELAA